jgi:glutathione peroxidase
MSQSVYDFTCKTIGGQEKAIADYKGKVLLVVNVASKCGFTPQYEGLEAMYQSLKSEGLEILGFPCNQFASQEKGSDAEIQSFCSLTYGVSFPMFSKVDVNGDNAAPIYDYMKSEAPGLLGSKSVKWNFTKFLVNKEGKVVKRYAPKTDPKAIVGDVKKLLAA